MKDNELLIAFENLLKEHLKPINQKLSSIEQDVAMLKKDVAVLKEDVAMLKKDVAVLKEDVAMLKGRVGTLDQKIIFLDKKVMQLGEKTSGIELHLEHITDKNIKILAENHLTLVDKLNESIKVSDKRTLFEIKVSYLSDELDKLKREFKEQIA